MNTFTEAHAHSPPRPSTSHKPTQTILEKTLNPAHEGTHEEPFNPKHAKIRILITRPPSQEFSTLSPNKTSQSFLMEENRSKARIHVRPEPTSLPKAEDLLLYCFTAHSGPGFPVCTARASQAASSTTFHSSSYCRCRASNLSAPHLVSGRRVRAGREGSSRPDHAISYPHSA